MITLSLLIAGIVIAILAASAAVTIVSELASARALAYTQDDQAGQDDEDDEDDILGYLVHDHEADSAWIALIDEALDEAADIRAFRREWRRALSAHIQAEASASEASVSEAIVSLGSDNPIAWELVLSLPGARIVTFV